MRLLVIVWAYAAAGFAGLAGFMGPVAIEMVLTDGLEWTTEGGRLLLALLAATMIYPLPVAGPALLMSEIWSIGSPYFFVAAGLILGLLLTFALTEVPFRGVNWTVVFSMIVGSLAGAMTYWLVAWKWLPPRVRHAT